MRTVRVSALMIATAASCLVAGAPASLAASDIVVREKEKKAYDCHGGSLTVEGGFNVLTLRNCSQLTVEGGDNTIDAGLVDIIEVSGADNKITWAESPDGRRPRITNEGEDNVIVSRRAAASDGARSPAPPTSSGSAAATSGSTSSGAASRDRITVSGNQVKVQGADGSVTVNADGTITLKDGSAAAGGKIRIDKDGSKDVYDCKGASAVVNGDRNELTFRNCSQIVINGDDNKVSWEPAEDGSRPRITDNGKGNSVTGKR